MAPRQKNQAAKKTKYKKGTFLQTKSSVKPYTRAQLDKLFADMHGEMKTYNPEKFEVAVLSIGTHAPKLASSRNTTRALNLTSHLGNRHGTLAGSGNGADASYIKVLLRPITILGESGEDCFLNRYQAGNDPQLTDAFRKVFGVDAEAALQRGLQARQAGLDVSVTNENCPVFFIPGKDGGDLQVSPGGNIESHLNMGQLRGTMLSKAKADRENARPYAYGEWSQLDIVSRASWSSSITAPAGPASSPDFPTSCVKPRPISGSFANRANSRVCGTPTPPMR